MMENMNTQVYRSGVVATPAQRGVEAGSFLAADAVKPAGRQGRSTAIFASPSLRGVLRWLYSNTTITSVADPFVKELKVNPDTVWVYDITAWEKASSTETYEPYWESGMTLTEWLANADQLDPAEWELLLGADDIVSIKPVSDKRALSYLREDDLFFEALPRALKDARRK
ncbi:MAG: hypothetical protein H9W81_07675 [Enterococcus sp.]|nr:hypothetical protein [Enterococcus sp.]